MKHWISAFRLRTLPLALSSILMGNFLAFNVPSFSWVIFLLSVLTTIFLQILSNLANDYGDSVHGADSSEREGPTRAVQAGLISPAQMKAGMMILAILSLVSGTTLLFTAFEDQWLVILTFLAIGLVAIYAAVTYTAGKNPYGYAGLGDISVFIFFGIVGVIGSFFLQAQTFDWWIIFPAVSCGAFSTGVLNVNNIRDISSDEKAGKRSIPVRMGRANAVIYHAILLSIGWLSVSVYVYRFFNHWSDLLVYISLPLFLVNFRAVRHNTEATALDPYLKQLAISTLLFVVLFAVANFF